ncbi:MAG: hypothetical protein C0446_13275 [Chitinophaga sp.]|nr:hypothetical protein [Chitinophaga sp.]
MGIDLVKIRENRINDLVAKCKSETDKKGVYTITKDEFSKLQSGDVKRVIALIEKDKRYICKEISGSIIFETKHNPNYKKWHEIDWFTAVVTFLFGIAATLITQKIQNTEQSQQIQRISDSLEVQKESLDKIKKTVYFHQLDSLKHK